MTVLGPWCDARPSGRRAGRPDAGGRMPDHRDVIVVGSGNAALCAAIAAKERGRDVLVIEKARPDLAGGKSTHTAGAIPSGYAGKEDLLPLLQDPDDPRLASTEFGSYTAQKF